MHGIDKNPYHTDSSMRTQKIKKVKYKIYQMMKDDVEKNKAKMEVGSAAVKHREKNTILNFCSFTK